MNEYLDSLTPLDWLVAASSRQSPQMLRLLFALDRKCARIALSAREPILGQMRLAWWRDVLTDRLPGKGEPLADALRADGRFALCQPHLVRIIDGWEGLCIADAGADEPFTVALETYARERGGGLFGAVAAVDDAADAGLDAAKAWALWDVVGQLDGTQAQRAIALGKAPNGGAISLARPLRILVRLSQEDLARGRGRPDRFTPEMYWRVVKAQLLGR